MAGAERISHNRKLVDADGTMHKQIVQLLYFRDPYCFHLQGEVSALSVESEMYFKQNVAYINVLYFAN
jgi:hypothetical protein